MIRCHELLIRRLLGIVAITFYRWFFAYWLDVYNIRRAKLEYTRYTHRVEVSITISTWMRVQEASYRGTSRTSRQRPPGAGLAARNTAHTVARARLKYELSRASRGPILRSPVHTGDGASGVVERISHGPVMAAEFATCVTSASEQRACLSWRRPGEREPTPRPSASPTSRTRSRCDVPRSWISRSASWTCGGSPAARDTKRTRRRRCAEQFRAGVDECETRERATVIRPRRSSWRSGSDKGLRGKPPRGARHGDSTRPRRYLFLSHARWRHARTERPR